MIARERSAARRVFSSDEYRSRVSPVTNFWTLSPRLNASSRFSRSSGPFEGWTNEVAFILHGPLGFHALEVKNTAQVRPSDLRGLRAFGEDYPEATRWLIYRGKERFLRDGVTCIPAEEFLRGLRPGAFSN